jgi:hypothetical protein
MRTSDEGDHGGRPLSALELGVWGTDTTVGYEELGEGLPLCC